MKKLVFISLFVCGLSVLYLTGCDDMYSIHQEYLDRGEAVYTGVVDSVKAKAGYKRTWVQWFLNSDPRITKTVIFWNDNKDSLVVDISRSVNEPSAHETIIPVAEGSYVFKFITRDNFGHRSVDATFSEITVNVYGDTYVRNQINRTITSVAPSKIVWGVIETETMLYTTITYTDTSGEEKVVKVENSDTETAIAAQSGTIVTVVSTFQPKNGLDEVNGLPKTYEIK
ncbi:MAG: DUF4998 domain-containing protein [Dysgonamonadaceae bacterium]|nr:DUF4998 domain-containing protein [Dysgonamonadaceae bacterium]